MKKTLSVVIVNYNVRYYLEQCLRSIKASRLNRAIEVFVVDNHSADGSLEYIRPKFPDVIFIANEDNPGFSKANNQAIRQATGDYILLLNPDTVVGEDTLESVCCFMDEHPDAGGIGVRMIDGHGNFLPESKRGFPSPWNSFCKMFGLSKVFPSSPFFAKYHLRYLDENEIHKVDVLAGAFMLLRMNVLKEIGLLDEAFFMYGEDIDLSYRITKAGYCNYYLPESIIHYKGESTRKDLRYVKIFYEAMLIFFRKHYPHYGWYYRYLIRFSICLAGGVSAINQLLFFWKNKKEREHLFENKGKSSDDITFSTNEKSYQEIISEMNISENKKKRYWIYHPEINLAIASNEVLINQVKNGFIGK